MKSRLQEVGSTWLCRGIVAGLTFFGTASLSASEAAEAATSDVEAWSLVFVFAMATLIGLGVIERVSRLLHTPLMSLTNAISAIAVVGAIIVAGGKEYPTEIRVLGFIALVASMTNIVSGFLITDRMLKMFKQPGSSSSGEAKR